MKAATRHRGKRQRHGHAEDHRLAAGTGLGKSNPIPGPHRQKPQKPPDPSPSGRRRVAAAAAHPPAGSGRYVHAAQSRRKWPARLPRSSDSAPAVPARAIANEPDNGPPPQARHPAPARPSDQQSQFHSDGSIRHLTSLPFVPMSPFFSQTRLIGLCNFATLLRSFISLSREKFLAFYFNDF